MNQVYQQKKLLELASADHPYGLLVQCQRPFQNYMRTIQVTAKIFDSEAFLKTLDYLFIQWTWTPTPANLRAKIYTSVTLLGIHSLPHPRQQSTGPVKKSFKPVIQ